jgi:hypothetical protein
VQFFFSYPQEGLEQSIIAPSLEGIAEATLKLERTGQLDIAVQSDPVPRTVLLQITIGEEGPAIIVPITPTASPTLSPTPTGSPEPSPEPVNTEVPTATPQPAEAAVDADELNPPAENARPGALDLGLALTAAAMVAAGGFYVARIGETPTGEALRMALLCLVGSMIIYIAYILYAPASNLLRQRSGAWASAWIAAGGGVITLVAMVAAPAVRRAIGRSRWV